MHLPANIMMIIEHYFYNEIALPMFFLNNIFLTRTFNYVGNFRPFLSVISTMYFTPVNNLKKFSILLSNNIVHAVQLSNKELGPLCNFFILLIMIF